MSYFAKNNIEINDEFYFFIRNWFYILMIDSKTYSQESCDLFHRKMISSVICDKEMVKIRILTILQSIGSSENKLKH